MTSNEIKTSEELIKRVMEATVSVEGSMNKEINDKLQSDDKIAPFKGGKVFYYLGLTKYPVLKRVCKSFRGWKETQNEEDDWDILWTDNAVQPEKLQKMKPYQRINHFPGMVALTRKNSLARSIQRMQRFFPEEFDFFPQTWMLPSDASDFKAQFFYSSGRKKTSRTYIVKPEAGCQGRGIFLGRKLEEIPVTEHCVAQRYVARPFLIDGLKFDFRIYVVLASVNPCRVFIHEEGLVRFATEPYELPSSKNLGTLNMHLTNYAVNKMSKSFKQPSTIDDATVSHKRSLKHTLLRLKNEGHDVDGMMNEVADLVCKTLATAAPALQHMYKTCQQQEDFSSNMCFELLGFDVMLDHDFKPWLLEINHSPSFSTDSPLDSHIKFKVIRETIELMRVLPENRKLYKSNQRILANQRLSQSHKEAALASQTSAIAAQNRASLGSSNVKWGMDNPNDASILQAENRAQKAAERQKLICEALEVRTAWEDSHMGGFTRIYPHPCREKYMAPMLEVSRQLWEAQTSGRRIDIDVQATTTDVLAKLAMTSNNSSNNSSGIGNDVNKNKEGAWGGGEEDEEEDQVHSKSVRNNFNRSRQLQQGDFEEDADEPNSSNRIQSKHKNSEAQNITSSANSSQNIKKSSKGRLSIAGVNGVVRTQGGCILKSSTAGDMAPNVAKKSTATMNTVYDKMTHNNTNNANNNSTNVIGQATSPKSGRLMYGKQTGGGSRLRPSLTAQQSTQQQQLLKQHVDQVVQISKVDPLLSAILLGGGGFPSVTMAGECNWGDGIERVNNALDLSSASHLSSPTITTISSNITEGKVSHPVHFNDCLGQVTKPSKRRSSFTLVSELIMGNH